MSDELNNLWKALGLDTSAFESFEIFQATLPQAMTGIRALADALGWEVDPLTVARTLTATILTSSLQQDAAEPDRAARVVTTIEILEARGFFDQLVRQWERPA